MMWLKTSNLSVIMVQSIVFHPDVLALAPTAVLPDIVHLDIELFLSMGFAIQNTHRFDRDRNWLIGIAKLCSI
jgi:hypothetical protein